MLLAITQRQRTAALGLLAALGACVRNPATGASQIMLISEGQEIRMGQQYSQEVNASIGLYADSALQQYVQQLGTRLAAKSERPQLPWTFRVVDDPVVNAFALPGGFIYVTRGILAHLESEAQLAAVIGHEIGHVTARHSVSQMSRQQLAQFGFALGTIIQPGIGRYGDVASAALGVLFLKYSRDDERQADELGLRYLRRAGYDPHEMPDVFTMLARVSAAGGGGRVPEWLSTHPNPENRRERIEQGVAALPPDSIGKLVNRDSYLERLDRLVYGDNPREGFFRGARFFHPDLKFALTFPEGWKTSNQQQSVVAVSPQRDAIVELSLAREPTADAAARAFFSRPEITGGFPGRDRIHGLPAVTGAFTAQTRDGGALRGSVAFIEYGGAVYRLLAYSSASRWFAYQGAAERALDSFEPVSDPAILDVQPQRLEIVRLDRETTIPELARRRASPASVATLTLINQVEADTRLRTGELVKWIVGPPAP